MNPSSSTSKVQDPEQLGHFPVSRYPHLYNRKSSFPLPRPHMPTARLEHKDFNTAALTLPLLTARACWKLISTALPGDASEPALGALGLLWLLAKAFTSLHGYNEPVSKVCPAVRETP